MPISAPQTYKGPICGLAINKNGYPKRKNLKTKYKKMRGSNSTSLSDDENSDNWKVEEVIGLQSSEGAFHIKLS